MNLFLKLLSIINFIFFITVLTNFIFGLINPEWVFLWKVPPESKSELIFLNFMILMWGEIFILIVFRLTAPYALERADKLLNEGNKDEAMELYIAIIKKFIWPRVYRSRIPEIMELVINWLLEKKDDCRALKIAERAKGGKINLPEDLLQRLDQINDEGEDIIEPLEGVVRKENASLGKGEIISYINDLISDNENKRMRAFQTLKRTGDVALEPLIKSLEHENLRVRRQAAEALGAINTSACIKRLIKVFSDPRPEMFRRANYVLWLIGEPSVQFLVEKLRDDDPNVRGRAVIALREMIHKRRTDPSDRIWLDPSNIDATGNIRKDINVERVRSEVKDPLKKLLQDENKRVRKYALYALERDYVGLERKEEKTQERVSVAQNKKAEMGLSPLHIKEEERSEKRTVWLGKAKKLNEEGQYEKAIEYRNLVIRANLDNNGWAHYLNGCMLAKLDRPEEAAEYLKTALKLDPISSQYALELGRVFYKLGQWAEARSAFKKIFTMDGIVYGDDDKALGWMEKLDEEGH